MILISLTMWSLLKGTNFPNFDKLGFIRPRFRALWYTINKSYGLVVRFHATPSFMYVQDKEDTTSNCLQCRYKIDEGYVSKVIND